MMSRVMVISSDYNLKTGIVSELRKNKSFDVISTVLSVSQASNLFLRNQPNALIIDLENQNTTDIYLKALVEKNKLMVIIIGKHPGIAYIRSGLTNIIPKPIPGNAFSLRSFCESLDRKITAFAKPSVGQIQPAYINYADMQNAVPVTQRLIAIASSTGGTEALPVVLQNMPPNCPPILVVQHMPSMFTKQFADRLDRFCKISVKEAENGEYIKKGTAYVAPGDLHMRLVKKNQKLALECFMGDKIHGVRPAADITFNSILTNIGGNAVGVILTGMGADGARGLFELHSKGAKVIAQDKASCVVYGMPKAAYDLGAADYVLPLNRICDKIVELM